MKTWERRHGHLFVQFLKIVQDFLNAGKVQILNDLFSGDERRRNIILMLRMPEIVRYILENVREQNEEKIEVIFDKERPIISTGGMPVWLTSKPVWHAEKCHLNGIAMDRVGKVRKRIV